MLFNTWNTKQAASPLCRLLESWSLFVFFIIVIIASEITHSSHGHVWKVFRYFEQNCHVIRSDNNRNTREDEVLNDRANMNCVTSSSPTTGLRTIHLLRSILFRALPSHAIPAESTLCLHPRFNIRIGHKSSFRPNTAAASCLRSMINHRNGNSPWIFMWFFRSFSLTQFNLPVVMSMMKHSW